MAHHPQRLPLPVRLLNAAGRGANVIGIHPVKLELQALLDTACRNTGLTDFGDDDFREPLALLLDCLEKEGIAERCRDNGDRRVVKVRLTDKGRRIRSEFIQRRRDEVAKVFSKLNGEDKKALLYHLGEALHILQKI